MPRRSVGNEPQLPTHKPGVVPGGATVPMVMGECSAIDDSGADVTSNEDNGSTEDSSASGFQEHAVLAVDEDSGMDHAKHEDHGAVNAGRKRDTEAGAGAVAAKVGKKQKTNAAAKASRQAIDSGGSSDGKPQHEFVADRPRRAATQAVVSYKDPDENETSAWDEAGGQKPRRSSSAMEAGDDDEEERAPSKKRASKVRICSCHWFKPSPPLSRQATAVFFLDTLSLASSSLIMPLAPRSLAASGQLEYGQHGLAHLS